MLSSRGIWSISASTWRKLRQNSTLSRRQKPRLTLAEHLGGQSTRPENQMANRSYDALVTGGGPGCYSCAIRLGQLKQKVACIEKEEVGGVCLNWGCIPSKALIAASHLYEKAQHAGTMGIKVSKIELDVSAMQDWKGGIVKK